MKTDVLFKGAITLLGLALGILTGFIYTQAGEIADLKRGVEIAIKDNDLQYIKIEKNSDTLNDVGGGLKENSVHLLHIRTSIQDIKILLKEFYTRK